MLAKCLKCETILTTTFNGLSWECCQCGWHIKKRKYLRYARLQVIPKCVLYNDRDNEHKRLVRLRLNKPAYGESDFRCENCGEFFELCHLCHKGPVGLCTHCNAERPGSRYVSDWNCDSYECA